MRRGAAAGRGHRHRQYRRSARRSTRPGYARLREDAELLEAAGDDFNRARFEAGELSPMFFGSAVNNFGLEAFLDTFIELMPPPQSPRDSIRGRCRPRQRRVQRSSSSESRRTWSKAHRDRVAFLRIC